MLFSFLFINNVRLICDDVTLITTFSIWDHKSFSDENDRLDRDVNSSHGKNNSRISDGSNHVVKSWSCCMNHLIVFATMNKNINNVNRKRKLILSDCNDSDNYDDDHDDTSSKVAVTFNVIEIPTLFAGHFMICHDKYIGDKNNSENDYSTSLKFNNNNSSSSNSANNSNILVDSDSNIISISPHQNTNSVSIILTSSIKTTNSTSTTSNSTSINTTSTTEASSMIKKKMTKVTETIFSNDNDNDLLNISSKWIKISLDGNKEILLQRKLFYNNHHYHPINCTTIFNKIFMISKENIVLCYDSRYGTLLQSYDNHFDHLFLQQQVTSSNIATSISNTCSNIEKTLVDRNYIQNGWIVVQFKDENDDDNDHTTTTVPSSFQSFSSSSHSSSLSSNNILRLFTCNYNCHNLTYSVHQYHLNTANQIAHTTLANSIGRLKSSFISSSTTTTKKVLNNENNTKSYTTAVTKNTATAVTKNKKQIFHNNDNHNNNNKNSVGGEIDHTEWDVMNKLLQSSSISIISQPSLIAKAAVHQRIDTLALIVEYDIDLSEKSCIKILYFIMMLSSDISVSDISMMMMMMTSVMMMTIMLMILLFLEMIFMMIVVLMLFIPMF